MYVSGPIVDENEKPLQTTSFVIHATRGVIRDQKTRRTAIVFVLGAAVLLLIGGLTMLGPLLNPHEHPWRVIIFWLACIWLTLTAMLLAIFDLFAVRLETRRTERRLREEIARSTSST
jgi:MFS family permease